MAIYIHASDCIYIYSYTHIYTYTYLKFLAELRKLDSSARKKYMI